MSNLAHIRHEGEIEIPRPLCAREGDVFEVIEFGEDCPLTMAKGVIVLVQLSFQYINGLYIIEEGKSLLLVRLIFLDALKVAVQSLHPHFKSGTFLLNSISIYGRAVEIYPTGDLSHRWILFQPGMVMTPGAYELPLYAKKGPHR